MSVDVKEMLKAERGNMTQKDFAEKIGLSRSYLSELESGKRSVSVDTLEKIVKKMGKELIIEIR